MRRISESGLYIFLTVLMIVYYSTKGSDDGSVRRPPFDMPPKSEVPVPDFSTERPSAPPKRGLPEFEILGGDAKRSDASGSAVSVDGDGLYMTARHVIEGCDAVYIEADRSTLGRRQWMKAQSVTEHPFADLALIDLGSGRSASVGSATALANRPKTGETGVFVGYPQGKPGTVTAKALGDVNVRFRENRQTRRQRQGRAERGYAWSETGRYPGNLRGTLGGLSGGPAFRTDGTLVGIVIAESRRRGRVITSQPENMRTLTDFAGPAVPAFLASDISDQSDQLRRNRISAFVFCDVDG